ncbi:MFS transporter [Streptomyces sp. NPDC048665]|uniref:MFS transporter n=1 Tax=Streptomyces sp. NPDC048665 TaxID=3155490 RepID=UPI003429EE09
MGYALGIVVIVPFADRAQLRRISSVLLAITALALLAGALASSIAVLSTAAFVLSVTTVLPQLIMPTVSSMAARGQAGRALGAVGTGLTLGALLSRTVSGALAEATGTWRAGYFAAAAATALLLLVLPRYMPEQSPHGGQDRIGYLKLLASLPRLIVGHASLRLSAVLGATDSLPFPRSGRSWPSICPRSPSSSDRPRQAFSVSAARPAHWPPATPVGSPTATAPTPSTPSAWRPPTSPSSSSCAPATPWWPS